MKKTKVLVVGARGAFGRACLQELLRRPEFEVTAMVRAGGQPVDEPVRVLEGDATDREDLRAAAVGQDVILYGVNFPYHHWETQLLPAVQVLAEVATDQGIRVVLPGNIYGLDADAPGPLAEDAVRRAKERKGELRNQAEEILVHATERGARLVVLRAGDFFGRNAPNTWLSFMTEGAGEGRAMTNPQSQSKKHAWAFLPDVAKTVAELLQSEKSLGKCEFFHFRGHEVSALAMLEECRAALGRPQQKIRSLPWWALRIVGWFSPLMREVSRSRYLWEREVLLDQSKLESVLGDVPHTQLERAVSEALGVAPPTRGEPAHLRYTPSHAVLSGSRLRSNVRRQTSQEGLAGV